MENDSKKLLILGIAAIVIVLGGVLLYFSGALNSESSNGSLIIQPASDYNFGDIDILGGKKNVSFDLFNNSGESVEITSAITTCMCTEAFLDDKIITLHTPIYIGVINPAERKRVNVVFDPLAHGPDAVGPITREIIFDTNSAQTPVVKFRFDGNVVKMTKSK